jgi:hypothetical protein
MSFLEAVLLLSVIVLVVLLVMKKKGVENVLPQPKSADEVASTMTRAEKAELLDEYGTGRVPFEFTDKIFGEIFELNVQFVEVHGVRFDSLADALEKGAIAEKAIRRKMEVLDAELKVLRKEKYTARRHYHVEKTLFDGDVYFYQPCVIGIDTVTGPNSGKPARMAIQIEKDDDGSVGVTQVFVAEKDIANASVIYPFAVNTDSGREKFKNLIRSKKELYGAEVQEIDDIIKRLNKYNVILGQRRIKQKDGKFIIEPPTEEHRRELGYDGAPATSETVLNSETEAKGQVDSIFEQMVSSKE